MDFGPTSHKTQVQPARNRKESQNKSKTLGKQAYQKQKSMKNIVLATGQGRQVSGNVCQQGATWWMRRVTEGCPTHPHTLMRGTLGKRLQRHMWLARAFSSNGGHQRPQSSLGGRCHPTLPQNVCFKRTPLGHIMQSKIALKFFFILAQIRSSRL